MSRGLREDRLTDLPSCYWRSASRRSENDDGCRIGGFLSKRKFDGPRKSVDAAGRILGRQSKEEKEPTKRNLFIPEVSLIGNDTSDNARKQQKNEVSHLWICRSTAAFWIRRSMAALSGSVAQRPRLRPTANCCRLSVIGSVVRARSHAVCPSHQSKV